MNQDFLNHFYYFYNLSDETSDYNSFNMLSVRVRGREDPDADFKVKRIYLQNEEQEQKARLSRISKTFNYGKNKTMINNKQDFE